MFCVRCAYACKFNPIGGYTYTILQKKGSLGFIHLTADIHTCITHTLVYTFYPPFTFISIGVVAFMAGGRVSTTSNAVVEIT
jgi:hypothetical protein